MSLKMTVEIVADGHSTKCVVEVPLAALSLDGDPSHVTALNIADFAATTTAEVTKAVRRQASDFSVENAATNALDANVEEDDSLGTGTGYDDVVQKEGHLNFSQGSSAAPSPGDDVNKDWFRNARTEKFVEAQTALGLGTASSTLQPLQDRINEWDLRSTRDLNQPTSSDLPDRQEDCTFCDEEYCWDHPSRYADSHVLPGDTNCGKSSFPLYNNVAQPTPSDWGRDDRISQSGGDWENGLGFIPSTDAQAGLSVEETFVGAEAPGAQKINVRVLDVQDGPANVKQYTMNLDCELSALLREVAWDFCRSPRSMKLSYRGQMVQPTDTPKKMWLDDDRRGGAIPGLGDDALIRLHPKMSLKTTVQCHDNGDLVMSADVSMKSIGTTFIDNQPDEVAQRLQTVTCGLAGGLIKAVQGQAEAEETATGPKEIEDLASGQYLRTAKVDVTGRLPLILNCASSGETTVVFNFRFETHVTMCRIGLTREFYEALKAFAQHAAQPLEKLRFSHMGDTRMTVGFLNGATPVDLELVDGDLIEVSRQ
ncbi:hypothetical protein KC323_g4852 [Hortaea werneckii]|nr:hypothetical protein KC323_g4852 [Hortaea werneckii]